MQTIQLTKGKSALVDDEDYVRVTAAGPWFACKAKTGSFYACHWIPDYQQGTRLLERLHRFILKMGAFDGKMPNHIDGDSLNYQKYNLRIVTRKHNARNAQKRQKMAGKTCSSKFKGVSWYTKMNQWQVNIYVDGKVKFLGYFNLEEDAAIAYDIAAVHHFGEFARTNKMLGLL